MAENPLSARDPEIASFDDSQLVAVMCDPQAGILRRGRALMELGRRVSSEPELLEQVAAFISDPQNRRAVTIGNVTVSQAGAAGLVSAGAPEAFSRAKQLVAEWTSAEQDDFAWFIRSAGVTW